MLPEALFDSYKQYKADTHKIVQWLATTATKCGYSPPPSSAEAEQQGKSTKLKGRARKLAREAAAAGSNTPLRQDAEDTVKTQIVPLSQFLPMAEAIAKAATPARISTGLTKLFKRCIESRTGVTDWYQANLTDDDSDHEDGESGHGHFIGVLQHALQVLIPVHKLQELDKQNFKLARTGDAAEGKDKEVLTVTNAFGKLQIEDVDEAALEAMPSATVIPDGSKKPIQYEVEDDGSEWIFGVQEKLRCDIDGLNGLKEGKNYLSTRSQYVCWQTKKDVCSLRHLRHPQPLCALSVGRYS